DCGTPVNPLKIVWDLTIPGGKPPVKPWPSVVSPKKTQRVLHLSDIHVDRLYAEGSEADCKEDQKLCCRSPQSEDSDPVKVPAGKWGA
ncbi:hypothetical protein PMAYCL1PPCAC_01899, partial [Pristionchus mayeri]